MCSDDHTLGAFTKKLPEAPVPSDTISLLIHLFNNQNNDRTACLESANCLLASRYTGLSLHLVNQNQNQKVFIDLRGKFLKKKKAFSKEAGF